MSDQPQTSSKRTRDLGASISPYDPFKKLEVIKAVIFAVIGWYTITAEAFLRYNFGERYFSFANVAVGYMALTLVVFFSGFDSIISADGTIGGWWGILLMLGYLTFSSYHLWYIWVGKQIGRPQHSLYYGTSRLEPLGRLIMRIINPFVKMFVTFIGTFTLKSQTRQELNASLKEEDVVTNADVFTKRFIEPFVLLFLAYFVDSYVLSVYLFFCAIALAIHVSMAIKEERAGELDLIDSFIEANVVHQDVVAIRRMRRRMSGVYEQVRERVENDPEEMEILRDRHPTVADAMDALDDFFDEEPV